MPPTTSPACPAWAKRPPCASSPSTATSSMCLRGADKGEKGRLRERLLENADLARLSRTLATICRDAPVALDLDAWRLDGLGGGLARLRELGMNQAARRLAQLAGDSAPAPAPAAETASASDGDVETPPDRRRPLPRALPNWSPRPIMSPCTWARPSPPPRTRRGCACPWAATSSTPASARRKRLRPRGRCLPPKRPRRSTTSRRWARFCPRPQATPLTPCSPPTCLTRSAPPLTCRPLRKRRHALGRGLSRRLAVALARLAGGKAGLGRTDRHLPRHRAPAGGCALRDGARGLPHRRGRARSAGPRFPRPRRRIGGADLRAGGGDVQHQIAQAALEVLFDKLGLPRPRKDQPRLRHHQRRGAGIPFRGLPHLRADPRLPAATRSWTAPTWRA